MEMSVIMDAVRRDALEKSRSIVLTEKSEELLARTISGIMEMDAIVRQEGLLTLEERVTKLEGKDFIEKLLKKGGELFVDGFAPDELEEFLTTMYWVKAPNESEALAAYMVIRGLCLIQARISSFFVERLLFAMIPEQCMKYCQSKLEQCLLEFEEKIHRDEMVRYEKINYKVQDEDTANLLQRLSEWLLCMDGRNVQRLLRDVDNNDLVTAMTGLNENTRKIIFGNMSKGLCEMLISDYVRKFWKKGEVYYTDERKIKVSTERIIEIISKLVQIDELQCPLVDVI